VAQVETKVNEVIEIHRNYKEFLNFLNPYNYSNLQMFDHHQYVDANFLLAIDRSLFFDFRS
jgi:hypothetical protein